MASRRLFLMCSTVALAQDQAQEPAEKPVEFICPMDADIRQFKPGKCPRCGMKLVAGLPDPIEYPVQLETVPKNPKPGEKVRLRFTITHPKTGKPAGALEMVHERVFHLFLISEDLNHFAHEHPEVVEPGVFEIDWVFPVGGLWRILTDFYPVNATPQLIARSLLLPGGTLRPAKLKPDTNEVKQGANMSVSLKLGPQEPVAGEKTLLYYRVEPRESFEPFLGAMGHMLVASADLIDLVHTHPFLVDGGLASPPTEAKLVQFNVIFPRPGVYRVWAQFQRGGQVSTIPFNVPVRNL
ncbi:MAG: hypothetical protein FJW36_17370 [Acidobacteria bacterium]|nr:hypothetical protein [Acidobacteriota bacterium]